MKISIITTLYILLSFTGCEKEATSKAPVKIYKITVDLNSNLQEMDGFGASDAWRCQFVGKNWPLEKREKIADLLFSKELDANGNPKGIGLAIWRFYLGAGSMEQGADSKIWDEWRRSECFLNADGTYDWTKQEGQKWFLDAAKKRGVEKFLAFSISAPVNYTKNQKAYNPCGISLNIKPEYLDDYADFMVNTLDHFKSAGIPFDYLSPLNEPQWNWTANTDGWAGQEGTPAKNADFKNLCKLLSDKISEKGLNTKVVVAEAGNLTYLYSKADTLRGNQTEAFFSNSSPYYLGGLANVAPVMGGHSYFTVWPLSTLKDTRVALNNKIKAVNPSLKYWQTEYCPLEGANTDIDGGWNRDLTMRTALYISRIIHSDITDGNASSWQWWTALTRFDYKDGLIYLDNGDNGLRDGSKSDYCKNDGFIRDSKLLWSLGNYSLFVRPGMRRVKETTDFASIPDAGLLVSSFKDEATKKLVVVIINNSSSNKNISIETLGGAVENGELKMYETSYESNLASKGVLKQSKIQVLSKSVVSLVGTYK